MEKILKLFLTEPEIEMYPVIQSFRNKGPKV